MTARKVLTTTRELFSANGTWSQEAMAYDETDARLNWDDKRACSWCLEGGLKISGRRAKASRAAVNEALALVKAQLETRGFYGSLQGWNDRRDRSISDVRSLLDAAIAGSA